MRTFATVMASLLHIRVMLAAATVVLMLLGLVFFSGLVQDESGREISSLEPTLPRFGSLD